MMNCGHCLGRVSPSQIWYHRYQIATPNPWCQMKIVKNLAEMNKGRLNKGILMIRLTSLAQRPMVSMTTLWTRLRYVRKHYIFNFFAHCILFFFLNLPFLKLKNRKWFASRGLQIYILGGQTSRRRSTRISNNLLLTFAMHFSLTTLEEFAGRTMGSLPFRFYCWSNCGALAAHLLVILV